MSTKSPRAARAFALAALVAAMAACAQHPGGTSAEAPSAEAVPPAPQPTSLPATGALPATAPPTAPLPTPTAPPSAVPPAAVGPVAGTPAPGPLCGTDIAVISDTPADSGGTVTLAELQQRAAGFALEAYPPEFLAQFVVVGSGVGSYAIALPLGASSTWQFGTPDGELLAMARERDPRWADWLEGVLDRDSGGWIRGVSIDEAVDDDVVAFIVQGGPVDEIGDLVDAAAAIVSAAPDPGALGEDCGVLVNGGAGYFIEAFKDGRVTYNFVIPDEPTGVTWALTCDAPGTRAESVKKTCVEIARHFTPLPEVAD